MAQAFISYGEEDHESAKAIYEYLDHLLYCDPWFYKDRVAGGEPVQTRISRAIREARFFIMISSRASLSRKGFVHSEIHEALVERRKFPEGSAYIIVCCLDDLTLDDLPEELRGARYLNFAGRFMDGLHELKTAISEALDRDAQGAALPGVTVTTHPAVFDGIDMPCQFITVINETRTPVILTHVFYRDPDVDVYFEPASRTLPFTLAPHSIWETYIPHHRLPSHTNLSRYFRVRLGGARGTVLASRAGDPPDRGMIPAGPVPTAEILNYPPVDVRLRHA